MRIFKEPLIGQIFLKFSLEKGQKFISKIFQYYIFLSESFQQSKANGNLADKFLEI